MVKANNKVIAGADIRERFVDYFASKGHTKVASAPLIPGNDKTLLFTNAGMVQFKDVFTGREKRSCACAVSAQKCLRVSGKHNDLETVGRTARHHTFFEMLGNFSFGDYFKEQAIEYAWEFMTQTIGLQSEKLHVSVFTDDDESAQLWEKVAGIAQDHIIRLGEKDNFWSMGDTGPCGPCSEIHYDRGERFACDNPDCGVDCDCDRFLELWNLVFMQYNRDSAGNLSPLPNPSIDTGLGLERLASVVQDTPTNFETDLIAPIISHMERLTDVVYHSSPQTDVSFRVIGDHARAMAFLIADTVVPSNEGRGYVLRRIIRRALRHGRLLGVTEPFAHRLTGTVVEIMKDAYPELADSAKIIREVTLAEEKSFGVTLENGMKLIGEIMETTRAKGSSIISGTDAFRLYDTYGFPIDLAGEMAGEAGMSIDMDGFNKMMTGQKEMARKSWKGSAQDASSVYDSCPPTEFTGYDEEQTETEIAGVYKDGQAVQSAGAGDEVEILLARTPFYAESGGQVNDQGEITGDSLRAKIVDVQKQVAGQWVHKAQVTAGTVKTGDAVTAKIDTKRRNDIRRNHSVTHLLHSALRIALGPHVKQAGSLVGPEKMRFDYTHFSAVPDCDLERIEQTVNEKIMENLPITTQVKDLEEAIASGAMALFGEKYGDKARVVSMGDFSTELCGGTHARATGAIGLFKIVSESGVSAGARRIEAVTGWGAIALVQKRESELETIGGLLKSPLDGLAEKVARQIEKTRELEKENRRLKEKLFAGSAQADSDQTPTVEMKVDGKSFRVVAKQLEGADAQALRAFVDTWKNKLGSGVVVAGCGLEGKAIIAVGVTPDLTDRISAGNVVKQTSAIVGGGGGGRPDFAQAGGKNPEKLKDALEAVPSIIEKIINP